MHTSSLPLPCSMPRRFCVGFLARCAMLLLLAVTSTTLTGCKRHPTQFVSLAKLAAGPRLPGSQTSVPQYKEHLQDFYGTTIEVLESAELHRHALERVRALNPDLKEADATIHVSQSPGTAIFNVAAVGADPKYTRVFLDAVLDEFRMYCDVMREQQRNRSLTSLAEDVVKRESKVKDSSEKLQQFQKNNNVVVLMNLQNQSAEFLKQVTTEKNRLLLEISDMEATMKDVEGSLAARRIDPAGQPPAKGGNSTPQGGMTRAELDYLNTRSDLTVTQVDLETLRESKTPDAAKLEEATLRLEKLKKLLAVFSQQVVEATKTRKNDTQRRLELLDAKVTELTEAATQTGTKLAEYARLKTEQETADKTYRELLELIHKFQATEEMSIDNVSIMERASLCVEDVQPWWRVL